MSTTPTPTESKRLKAPSRLVVFVDVGEQDGETKEKKEDTKKEEEASLNKPIQRQRLILEQLQEAKEFEVIVKETRDQPPISAIVQVHDNLLYAFLCCAWEEAAAEADKDWFDPEKKALVPAYFTPPSARSQLTYPVYKAAGWFTCDTMTPILKHSFHHAATSASNSMAAARHILTHPRDITYALNRSPGHHAGPQRCGGYCFFNNGLLAAKELLASGVVTRVALLDLDYHAGDGALEWQKKHKDESIVAISIHIDPKLDYPSFLGHESDNIEKCAYNYCLPAKADEAQYMKALRKALNKIKELGCDAVIIPFGADTYFRDPDPSNKGGMQLDIADYTTMGAEIRRVLPHETRIMITQEGGYCMDAVGHIARAFVEGLLGVEEAKE